MPSIKGRYEYDDEDLTPGKKREGGLHQNLYDRQGELKGSARFIPDDDDGYRAEVAPPAKTRRQEEFEQALSDLASLLLEDAIARLKPHALRFWHGRARPAIRSKVDKLKNRGPDRRAVAALAPPVPERENPRFARAS